jgi:hypothetical protein
MHDAAVSCISRGTDLDPAGYPDTMKASSYAFPLSGFQSRFQLLISAILQVQLTHIIEDNTKQ